MHQFITHKALEIGFDACGISGARELTEDAEFFKTWIDNGMHADMHYLERNFEKRLNPQVLVPGTKSVVVTLLNYNPTQSQPDNAPKIARYAHSETDYHLVIKQMLSALELEITKAYGYEVVNGSFQHSFVDSAPVLERRWAQQAGLGWIGKHTQLIAPNIGSYCFIGTLFLNVETEYNILMQNRCGKCTRCIDACPTKALDGHSLDARKCISYQTIENKNTISNEIVNKLSGCLVGCDICAEVCPWNKKWAKPRTDNKLGPVKEIYSFDKVKWDEIEKDEFDLLFKNSAMKRAGYQKIKQNLSFLK